MTLGTPTKRHNENDQEHTPGSKSSGGSSNRRTRWDRRRIKNEPAPPKVEEPPVEVVQPEKIQSFEAAVEPVQTVEVVEVVQIVEEVKAEPVVETVTVDLAPAMPPQTAFSENLNRIKFRIYYKTVPKQDLFILGDGSLFGDWKEANLGFPLKWTEGHIWVGEIPVDELASTFTFKFICKEKDGSITWETRDNRKFDVEKIRYTLKTSHRLETKGEASLEKGAIKFEYDKEDGLVTLTYTWDK